MKKKIILFLSVLLIAMFLTGCVSVSITTNPENSEDNLIVIDNPFANIIGKKELKEYDERKTEIAEDVENIIVDSTIADVNISVSDSSNIEVHFYGEAKLDNDLNLDIEHKKDDVIIKLKYKGTSVNENLKLDISIPNNQYNLIKVESVSANISLSECISAKRIELNTSSGDVITDATFVETNISTMSGDVELYINSNEDISMDISTMSGDISIQVDNIDSIDFSTSTMTGDIRNKHEGSLGGYNAKGELSTMSGDIIVK